MFLNRMLYGLITTFTLDDFKQLLREERYDDLIYNCYYCNNQEEILGFLEKHLSLNNFILNYVYIRNCYKLGYFSDKEILRKCFTLALRTVHIIAMHINLSEELNRKFEVFGLVLDKFEEKFGDYIDDDVIKFGVEHSKREILNFVDAMSININVGGSPVSKKKMLDLPEPYIICNITRGSWRYPALKYESKGVEYDRRMNERFVSNYSGRCQRYYDAYRYVNERLKNMVIDYSLSGKLRMRNAFE